MNTHSAKRGFDVVASATLLVALLPVLAICAVLIVLASPGPIIFAQTREGKWRRAFTMYKLRTMRPDAERQLTAYLAADDGARREWEAYRRLTHDPRLILVVGPLLRRTSLDEIPQLWNVFIGDMSLVGPRPLELGVAEQLAEALRDRRAAVRPGMTGLWQVSGRSETNLEEMMSIDAEYLRDWAFSRDIAILARTPAAVLSRRGAY